MLDQISKAWLSTKRDRRCFREQSTVLSRFSFLALKNVCLTFFSTLYEQTKHGKARLQGDLNAFVDTLDDLFGRGEAVSPHVSGFCRSRIMFVPLSPREAHLTRLLVEASVVIESDRGFLYPAELPCKGMHVFEARTLEDPHGDPDEFDEDLGEAWRSQ